MIGIYRGLQRLRIQHPPQHPLHVDINQLAGSLQTLMAVTLAHDTEANNQ